MNNPDHISESLKPFFWVKIFKFYDADPGWKKFGSGIQDRHPGSVTLQKKKKRKKVRIAADLVKLAEDLRGGPVAGGGPGAEIKEGARPPAALLPHHLTEYVLQYGVLAATPDKTRERFSSLIKDECKIFLAAAALYD